MIFFLAMSTANLGTAPVLLALECRIIWAGFGPRRVGFCAGGMASGRAGHADKPTVFPGVLVWPRERIDKKRRVGDLEL